MRNWNPSSLSSWIFWSSLSDYLWGIETAARWKSGMTGKAFRLPMRNWNVEVQCPVCGKVRSFQTTYEELKLFFLIGPLHQPFRFQTTYEELKLCSTLGLSFACWAFRLPMRNWNLPSVQMPYRASLAFRLPMRNWNPCFKWEYR